MLYYDDMTITNDNYVCKILLISQGKAVGLSQKVSRASASLRE